MPSAFTTCNIVHTVHELASRMGVATAKQTFSVTFFRSGWGWVSCALTLSSMNNTNDMTHVFLEAQKVDDALQSFASGLAGPPLYQEPHNPPMYTSGTWYMVFGAASSCL
jgi:hypothetical protein